ncbi:GD13646 [Drosophila simulans]|uniref:Large ribosomal subunit protein mL46 n=1 Tax=Drosophila simulans TaxID=7240 RepID=B4QMK7_DROSI|nr:GD13646 [Drosophila simulans]
MLRRLCNAEKWDLYAGVLVERLPVLSKSLNPLEKQFQDLLWRVEYENSLKSDHELKHEREIVQTELIKQGKIHVDLEDARSKHTAQDLKNAYVEELKKYQLGSRTTPDDKANRTTSTDRCLDDTLYLLGKREEGESMRQTAERVLRESCGQELQVLFYGNAPVGFHKYKYPRNQRTESVGAKVFFYRASLRSGQVPENLTKFEWLPKEALNGKLTNAAYAESVKKFLL